jgi:hypothetical protein
MNILHILKDYENKLGSGDVIAATPDMYDDVCNAIAHLENTHTPHLIERAHNELVKAKADLLFVSMYNDPNPSLKTDVDAIIKNIDNIKQSISSLTTPTNI